VDGVTARVCPTIYRGGLRRDFFKNLIFFNKYFNINRPTKYFASGSLFGRANSASATK
jgi:hypothetical protein